MVERSAEIPPRETGALMRVKVFRGRMARLLHRPWGSMPRLHRRREKSLIYDIVIPALGATDGDVVLEEWRAQPGEFVKAGTPLFVVTTDKATVEVEAFRDGYLREILNSAGATVPVQTVVGRMADMLEEPLSGGTPG